ncbi:hypothetical protein A2U01_0100325, partial [Trifolium medium]|nr:hypothetical protein [Trifolium medium]
PLKECTTKRSLSAGYLIYVLLSKDMLEATESGDDKGVPM